MSGLWVQFSDCGQHIRRWSHSPFDEGVPYSTVPDWRLDRFIEAIHETTPNGEWVAVKHLDAQAMPNPAGTAQ